VVAARKENGPSLEEIRKLADGRVYTAEQALEFGLVDKVGYFQTALDEVLSRAGLKEARVVAYTYYPKRQNNLYATSLAGTEFMSEPVEKIVSELKTGFYYLWLPAL